MRRRSKKLNKGNRSGLTNNFAERSVFASIANRFEISAPELTKQTGMPGSTIAGILKRLVQRGMVFPCGTETQQRGRPSICYRVRIPHPICACQVEATQVSAAVFDCNLNLLRVEVEGFGVIGSLQEGVDSILTVVRRIKPTLRKLTGQRPELALALNAIRMVPDRHRLVSSVLPWAELNLAKSLANKLGMRVKIVPSTGPLIAESQKLHSRNSNSVVRFQVGDGISAHMAFGGKTYQGHCLLAGELGHVTVDPGGPLCGCGRRGCLEACCGGPALHKFLLEELACGIATIIRREDVARSSVRASVDLLWEAWKMGDSYAREFMRPVLDHLAWALGIVMNLIDPELVLACGYVLNGRPEWVEDICQRAQRWTLYAPARPIRMVLGQATLEDELRITGALYFYQFHEYN